MSKTYKFLFEIKKKGETNMMLNVLAVAITLAVVIGANAVSNYITR